MNHLHISTSTNVELEYEIAGLSDRIFAFLIDMVLIAAYGILISLFSGFFPDGRLLEEYGMLAFLMLPPLFYHLACEVLFDGTTAGKKAMKIQVSRTDGKEPSVGDYLLRWIMRLPEIMACFGSLAVFSIIWDEKGQRLGDRLAGTTVVKLKKRVSFEDTIFRATEEEYEVRFPEVTVLPEEEIALIAELDQEARKLPYRAALNPILKKARIRISEKLKISPQGSDASFLSQLLKDYNYLQNKQS
jgi:uncharacterized RDD family membrane protein YckC